MTEKRHVYIVDDDSALCGELAEALVVRGFDVLTFLNGEDLIDEAPILRPGCILLDLNLPGRSGLEVQEALKATHSPHVVVMLSGEGTVSAAVRALHAGAADFLEKPFRPDQLASTIAQALARHGQDGQQVGKKAAAQAKVGMISEREREVLSGLLLGLPNKIIAYRLGLSVRTVETYRANLMDKLGVRSLSEAVRIAIDAELVASGRITVG